MEGRTLQRLRVADVMQGAQVTQWYSERPALSKVIIVGYTPQMKRGEELPSRNMLVNQSLGVRREEGVRGWVATDVNRRRASSLKDTFIPRLLLKARRLQRWPTLRTKIFAICWPLLPSLHHVPSPGYLLKSRSLSRSMARRSPYLLSLNLGF